MLDTLCIPLMTHTETYSFSASLSVLLLSIACYSPVFHTLCSPGAWSVLVAALDTEGAEGRAVLVQ